MESSSLTRFLSICENTKYKILYSRIGDKDGIYVKTDGLNKIGLHEVFTVSRSNDLDAAYILINRIVESLLITDQRVGIRKDIIRHPVTRVPLRYLVKLAEESERCIIVVGPDENNMLPGEKGYKHFT